MPWAGLGACPGVTVSWPGSGGCAPLAPGHLHELLHLPLCRRPGTAEPWLIPLPGKG